MGDAADDLMFREMGLSGHDPFERKAEIFPCPFCGKQPSIERGKKSHCQLHGEPMQPMVIRCKNSDCCRPLWAAGDVFNGGEEKAKQEVIEKWNRRYDFE